MHTGQRVVCATASRTISVSRGPEVVVEAQRQVGLVVAAEVLGRVTHEADEVAQPRPARRLPLLAEVVGQLVDRDERDERARVGQFRVGGFHAADGTASSLVATITAITPRWERRTRARSSVSTTSRNRPRPVFSMRIGGLALVEAAFQQDEPALEVVAELGELERRVEPHLLVGELAAAVAVVVVEQRPQDPAGDPLMRYSPSRNVLPSTAKKRTAGTRRGDRIRSAARSASGVVGVTLDCSRARWPSRSRSRSRPAWRRR